MTHAWPNFRKSLLCTLLATPLLLAGCGGGGGGSSSSAPSTKSPLVGIAATSKSIASSSTGRIAVSLGSEVSLSGLASTDVDQDQLTFEWKLTKKPTSSNIKITSSNHQSLTFVPDAMGQYDFVLIAKDSKGAISELKMLVDVDNRAPVAASTVNVEFNSIPKTHAPIPVSVNSTIELDGSQTTDPEGQSVQLEWRMLEKPTGSQASVKTSQKTASLSVDKIGSYKVAVRGIDTQGAYVESIYTFNADNRAPTLENSVDVTFVAIPSIKPTQAVSVGDLITLDSSASFDVEGSAVTPTWALKSAPQGSKAALDVNGKVARLTTDVKGTYQIVVRGTDREGAYAESVYTFNASNAAPSTVVSSDIKAVVGSSGSNTLNTSLGYSVMLNGADSKDPEGSRLSYQWELVSKPAGSVLDMTANDLATLNLTPDVLGDYTIKLTTKDAQGAASSYTTVIKVNNQRPVAVITSNATPQSLPGIPALRLPIGTEITLRGGASRDADGDQLTYTWSVKNRPVGSTAALVNPNQMNAIFTPDKEGMYTFVLRVQDADGAYSEQSIVLDTGNLAPVPVVDKANLTVVSGASLTASAANSFDEDGDKLSYSWTIDARPVGSTAQISSANNAKISFTPDKAGVYSLAVSISDGKNTSVAYVGVKALATNSGSVELNFVPLHTEYSRGLDRLVALSANPLSLKTVDPFSGSIRSVSLPEEVKEMSLSPDGNYAALLHKGKVSLIDLKNSKLIKTFGTSGTQTDVFVTNSGVVYLIGGNGQWNDIGMFMFNGITGQSISTCCGFTFYGSQHGIYADKINKIFLIEEGLSPSDISYISLDPKTGEAVSTGDSPYHGDYSMYSPMFLSDNQDYVFTNEGNYFQTGSLKYAGALKYSGYLMSFSHYAAKEEALLLSMDYTDYYDPAKYPTEYTLLSGSLFVDSGKLPLPKINGEQSYGHRVFHSANGSHVALVHTGTNTTPSKYHVIYR